MIHVGSQILRQFQLCSFSDDGMILCGMYIIVSDLHIGSRHFKCTPFLAFLQSLPQHAILILNGDTFDGNWSPATQGLSRQATQQLTETTKNRRVLIVEGNHDGDMRVPLIGIEYRKSTIVNGTLFVTHGDDFDNVMPRNRLFVFMFRWLHQVRVRMGATPIHVAQYAKRWRVFFQFLRNNVMLNAVEHAKEQGYKAMACGHVHFPEDRMIEGIRYFNTGCWTEDQFFYLRVDGQNMRLVRYTPGDEIS